jgi:hypothetical protein
MLLCLSSGHARRYREDVLRSAGLPAEAVIQFRYDDRHLGPGVRSLINAETIVGHQVLIAYCDQAEKDREPEMIPCRYATIVSFERAGTTVSVKLRLQDHAYSEQLAAFNTELHQLTAGLIPHRTETGKVAGSYFVELNVEPRALVRTRGTENWQRLTEQLASRADFNGYETFLLVRQVSGSSGTAVSANRAGQIELKAGTRYVVKLYQYHPTKVPTATRIEATTANTRVHFLSDSSFPLDSRYDHKELYFEVRPGIEADESTLKIVQKNGAADEFSVEYDLPFTISSGWIRALGYVLLLTLCLAAPHFVSELAKHTPPNWTLIGVATVSSICAALIAVFQIRRII